MPRTCVAERTYRMKKLKGLTLTRGQQATLLATLCTLGIGVLLFVFGTTAAFLPLRMGAWLHFTVGVLLLLNFLWPLACKSAAEKQAIAKERLLAASAQEDEGAEKGKHQGRTAYRVRAGFLRWCNLIGLLLELAALAALVYFFLRASLAKQSVVLYSYLPVLIVVAGFVMLLILAKALRYFMAQEKETSALVAILDVLRFNLLLLAIGMVIHVTALFDMSAVLRIVEYVVALYCAVFLVISLVGGFLRGACSSGVRLFIPRPFSKREDDEEDLISYLERSTGMTLRSLFGIKIARKILPIVCCVVVAGFWLSTGIAQVETYERGALYRLGRCEKILEPGVHLTLPWPFDKVELYETEKVQEMVVGYENSDRTNLLWDESHGGTEYKLLLGDGNELVSVNLRIKYKIDDLYEYVTCSAEPAEVLNAKAYSVVTDLTVRTTLDALLAEDRAALSQTIEERLGEYLDGASCGLCVTDVIVESIHPPVELSTIYRDVVSAELEREAQIDASIGVAEATKIYAELKKNQAVQEAMIRQNKRVAEAEAAVSEFMAMVAAYENYPDAYCYYKYLEALAEVYEGRRLYILGEGIDERYIYFKDGVVIYNPAG